MPSAAVRYDRGSPTIVVRNESKRVTDRELARLVRALQVQIDRDFFPLWGWRAKLRLNGSPSLRRAMRIRVRDVPPPEERGEEGYHFIDGLPQTFVYTCDDHGKAIPYHSTLSHEVLEMIADPAVNLYAQGHYRTPTGRHVQAWIPYEICDPVQGGTYEIDRFPMSDFVVPEWYEPERERGSMRFSFLDSVREPFEIAKGGYIDAVVGERLRTIWGTKAYRKKRRHRFRVRQRAILSR